MCNHMHLIVVTGLLNNTSGCFFLLADRLQCQFDPHHRLHLRQLALVKLPLYSQLSATQRLVCSRSKFAIRNAQPGSTLFCAGLLSTSRYTDKIIERLAAAVNHQRIRCDLLESGCQPVPGCSSCGARVCGRS